MLFPYYLQVKFGDSIIPVSTNNLMELTIVQDINKFLPEFRMRIQDTSGGLTHIAPFDRNMNKVTIELALTEDSKERSSFNFSIYSREPESDEHTPSSIYDISGLLDMPSLFNPSYSRGFLGNVKSNLESLGTSLGASSTNVSESLNYTKTLVQPTWTNAQFLNHLKKNLLGVDGSYGYKCHIANQRYSTIFQFKALSELIKAPITRKFILNDQPFEDRYPIFNYYIYDYYKIYGSMGAKVQDYSYFDYNSGTFIKKQEQVSNYFSLSDYFLIDGNDSTESNEINNTGRTNDFDELFQGRVKGYYGNKVNNLVKMWITTTGTPSTIPGEVVELFFPQGATGTGLYSYQYAGYWLVEQVLHMCGTAFYTKLLLTRPGLDTDNKTTLVPATSRKKV